MKTTAVIALLGGCSYLFQNHATAPFVGPDAVEPTCDMSDRLPYVDVLITAIAASATALALDKSSGSDVSASDKTAAEGTAGTAATVAIIFGISAMQGFGWTNGCRAAMSGYLADQKTRPHDTDEQLRERQEIARRNGFVKHCFDFTALASGQHNSACRPTAAECVASRSKIVDEHAFEVSECKETFPAKLPEIVPPPVTGFFCTASVALPAAGVCVRKQADCEATRTASAASLPDLTTCAHVDAASCFLDGANKLTCLPTAETCDARRGLVGSDAAACQEVR